MLGSRAECKEIKEIARRTAYEEGLKSGRSRDLRKEERKLQDCMRKLNGC